MPRFVIVLRDLYPVRLDRDTRAALPRLPALESWLAQGDSEQHSGDWRQWLWARFADDAQREAPPAAIAGTAVAEVPEGLPVWFATPVHFVAGLDTVRLHPAGLLELSAAEQQALAADFARVFSGSGYSLHVTGRRELLLAGGEPAAAVTLRTHDPAMWLGADPRAGFPVGAGAAALRRLGAELEMWLHEHPVNQARAGRGLLAANALWLWGGGAPTVSCSPGAAVRAEAWADDLFVDGLSRFLGGAVMRRPERWPGLATDAALPTELLAVCELGAAPDQRSLLALDCDWFAPLFAHWRRGGFESATLLAGPRASTLRGSQLRRLWRRFRRTRPWWETLLQC